MHILVVQILMPIPLKEILHRSYIFDLTLFGGAMNQRQWQHISDKLNGLRIQVPHMANTD